MKNTIRRIIDEHIAANTALADKAVDAIEKAARTIAGSLQKGGKLLVFGNGGSAADSQHLAAELVGRFKKERRGLGAIALTTNTSILTAVANDYSYEATFSRQVEALGREGDVAFGISTSGNSRNVLEGIRKAKGLGLATIGLSGADGGLLARECDIALRTVSNDTPRIQEGHLLIIHILCELIEDECATL